MSATNLFMNWTGVSIAYTPSGGSLTTVNVLEVLDVDFDYEETLEKFAGDARKTFRLIVATLFERKVAIVTGNIGALQGIPPNTPCTIVATLNDALNGTGTGAITYTCINAVRKSLKPKSPNNKFGVGTIMFEAYGGSSDTDPLSYAVAS